MTRTAILVIFALILLAAASGAYYYRMNRDSSVPAGTDEAALLGGETSLASTTTLPTGSNTSDASLDTDLSVIDAQLGALSSDSNAVGTSLTDTAVAQSTL